MKPFPAPCARSVVGRDLILAMIGCPYNITNITQLVFELRKQFERIVLKSVTLNSLTSSLRYLCARCASSSDSKLTYHESLKANSQLLHFGQFSLSNKACRTYKGTIQAPISKRINKQNYVCIFGYLSYLDFVHRCVLRDTSENNYGSMRDWANPFTVRMYLHVFGVWKK